LQALAEVQDTPSSSSSLDPVGLGVVRIVQVVPFHCSANVMMLPEVLV